MIAKKLNAEIICMDSRQIYKGFRIGTAQPSKEEMNLVPHHLVDFLPPTEQYNAALFAADVKNILAKNPEKKFILSGGTGLYLQTITLGLSPMQASNSDLREKLKEQYRDDKDNLYQAALKINPAIEGVIMPGDKQRLLRVLELNGEVKAERVGGIGKIKTIFLDLDRDELYKRINERVIKMLENGWQQEAKELAKSIPLNAPAWQSLGYLDLINASNPYSIAETIALKSRHYAKRQITWFKNKEKDALVVKVSNKQRALDTLEEVLHEMPSSTIA